MHANFSVLKGKILIGAKYFKNDKNFDNQDVVLFVCSDGTKYAMYHTQDCCESVCLESTDGDLSALIGDEILLAEETSNSEQGNYDGSQTWSFYKLQTNRAYVTLRWLGESNGYYSESVDFYQI